HGPFLLSEFLINAWGFETHTVAEQQIGLGIEPELLRCLESQSHPSRVSTRRNFKIVFQTSLVSVINKVNSWVNVLIPHPRKLRNIAMPFGGIISDEVIALAGKSFVTGSCRVLIGSVQNHTNDLRSATRTAHR